MGLLSSHALPIMEALAPILPLFAPNLAPARVPSPTPKHFPILSNRTHNKSKANQKPISRRNFIPVSYALRVDKAK